MTYKECDLQASASHHTHHKTPEANNHSEAKNPLCLLWYASLRSARQRAISRLKEH